MGLLCLIIVIWALADGSVTSLLVVFGILVVLSLLTSNPVVGLFIVLAIILYALFYKEETKDNNKDEIVNQTKKEETSDSQPTANTSSSQTITSIEDKTECKNKDTVTDDHSTFLHYITLVKECPENDSNYADNLFHLGLLYEKIYTDYFRATGYIFLATEHDKKNIIYEKEYIRLCRLLEKEKGSDWVYYITLIKNIDDIDIYVNRLFQHVDENNSNRIQNIKPTKVNPTPRSVTKSRIQTDSKFEDFNTESYLHSLGYKVGKTGLSKTQRRNLLKKAIESGRITKYDVIETLERNISMFHRRGNMQQAINDWLDDLTYVRSNF